jgi:MATE family multidrug resistance protein
LTYFFFGENLLYIFTDKESVIQAALPFLFWMILLPILGTPSYIWDGIYVGLTASKAMRNSMILSLIIYLGSFFLLKSMMNEIDALWLSLLIFLFIRGIIQWAIFWKKGLQIA